MSVTDDPEFHASSLLELMDLRRGGGDSFTAPTTWSWGPRLFGGLVAAQSLAAACRTVGSDHRPHSLHAYFILAGDSSKPLHLDVERTRDGRSFTTRRVLASQGGGAIFEMSASFHRDEEGDDWSMPVPVEAPPPDDVEPWLGPDGNPVIGHFEMRPLQPATERYVAPPYWVRTTRAVPEDDALRACILTYLSDMGILALALAPDASPIGSATSLDHSIWFHRPYRPEEWHLFVGQSRSNRGGRGIAVGGLHHRDGALVATIAQEGLFRPPR
jgi:acyl-CoA thioesterase II